MIGQGIATLSIGIAIAVIGYRDPLIGMMSLLFGAFCCIAIWQ